MPFQALRPCATPGCPERVKKGHCDLHAKKRKEEFEARRPTASARLYGSEWRVASREFLRFNPWCVGVVKDPDTQLERRCGAKANTVDHRISHKGDLALFWDRSNWQPMCRNCHSGKTAREDGRWEPKVW